MYRLISYKNKNEMVWAKIDEEDIKKGESNVVMKLSDLEKVLKVKKHLDHNEIITKRVRLEDIRDYLYDTTDYSEKSDPVFWQLFPYPGIMPPSFGCDFRKNYTPENGEHPVYFIHRTVPRDVRNILETKQILQSKSFRNQPKEDEGIYFHKFVPSVRTMDVNSPFYILRDPNYSHYGPIGFIFPLEEIIGKYPIKFSKAMIKEKSLELTMDEYINPYKYISSEAIVKTKSISVDGAIAVQIRFDKDEIKYLDSIFEDVSGVTLKDVIQVYQTSDDPHIVKSTFREFLDLYYDEKKENAGLPLIYANGLIF